MRERGDNREGSKADNEVISFGGTRRMRRSRKYGHVSVLICLRWAAVKKRRAAEYGDYFEEILSFSPLKDLHPSGGTAPHLLLRLWLLVPSHPPLFLALKLVVQQK